MSSPTETATFNPASAASGFMAGFSRYGLPGMVIGVLFAINSGLTYVLVTNLKDVTRAMVENAAAINRLADRLEVRSK